MAGYVAVTSGPIIGSGLGFPLLGVWILLSFEFAVARGEVCQYEESKYDPFASNYKKRIVDQECKWGCCNYRNTACCGPPISLIVGCVLGGILMLSLFVVGLCCCCVCRNDVRQRQNTTTTHQSSVVFHSTISGNIEEVEAGSDPPPSYEEVMRGEVRGQVNQGFKPDS